MNICSSSILAAEDWNYAIHLEPWKASAVFTIIVLAVVVPTIAIWQSPKKGRRR